MKRHAVRLILGKPNSDISSLLLLASLFLAANTYLITPVYAMLDLGASIGNLNKSVERTRVKNGLGGV